MHPICIHWAYSGDGLLFLLPLILKKNVREKSARMKHYQCELYPGTLWRLLALRRMALQPGRFSSGLHPHPGFGHPQPIPGAQRSKSTAEGERAGEGAPTLCRELGLSFTPRRGSQGWGRALPTSVKAFSPDTPQKLSR